MLRVEDLVVNYGNIVALQGISFHVEDGETVSLIGANGAGKSTTLMTLSGIIKPKTGTINFNGKNIVNKKSHQIVQMGLIHVPEGRQIFDKMTIEENLILGGFNVTDHDALQERREQVFRLFPILKERIHQSAGTLSGGEQQMLAIGRAIMAGPKMLLLDEPSLGLAPIVVQEVFNVIQKLKEAGITILLVEQNANEALRISDRTYILENGRVVMSGKSSDLIGDEQVRKAYLGGE